MKIRFLINNAYGHSGTVRTTLNTAGALAARGHEVEVVSVLRHRARPSYPVPPAVSLRPLTRRRPRLKWGRRRALLRWVAQGILGRRPSRLIHPQDRQYRAFSLWTDLMLWRYLSRQHGGVAVGTTAGLNLVLARRTRPDVLAVGTEHLHLGRYGPGLRAALAARYPSLYAVVTLTERDARAYRSLLGPPSRVLAIPNAVPDLGRPAARTPAAAGGVVVAAGRLAPQKGFDLLLRAWRGVAQAYPDWTLRIYGKGAERGRLQAMIDRSGLTGRVQLMGFVDDLPEVLTGADLFVLSSRFEGMPMVLLEAMAAGVPVVAFDCPTGPSTLIRPEVNGLLAPPRSVPQLTAAINRAIGEPDLRRRMGQAGQLTTLAYGRDLIAQQWEELLTSPPVRGIAPGARSAYGPMSAPSSLNEVETRSGRAG